MTIDLTKSSEASIEAKIKRMLQEHIRRVLDTVHRLILASEAYNKEDSKKLDAIVKETIELEEEADKIKRRILETLVKAAPGFLYREDWMKLAIQIDKVSDYACEYVCVLTRALDRKWKPKEDVGLELNSLCEEAYRECEKLREALLMLSVKVENALPICKEVHDKNYEVTLKARDLRFKILEEETDFRVLHIIERLVDLVDFMAMEMQEAADSIRLIVVSKVG